jgi:predicted 3-demethylubiquinone-9 3-methyltransferase (glyoxalase superfamily)
MYPCLWFESGAKEAADFYCSVFKDARILSESPIVATFELSGTKFMALNGGPMYRVNPAVSYFVYCGSDTEIDRIYAALAEGGQVLMALDTYDWAEKYAWLTDRYGVSWQLDRDDINSTQKIVPSFLFANEKMALVKRAMTHYAGIFKSSRILLEAPYPESADVPDGMLLFAQFKLNDFIFNAMSSTYPHEFDFTHGNSFVIECETQDEIDHYWNRLGEGGEFSMCGWLADKYGISWQVIPAVLAELMADPEKGPRVVQAFLKMQKFDIEALLKA